MENSVKIKDDTQSLQSCVSVSVTDLRIGNLIMRFNKIYEVWNLSRKDLELDSQINDHHVKYCTYDELKPIPLTEEWLLKLKDTPIYMDKEGFVIFKNSYSYAFIWEDYPFLHQLQNLYFSITGCELQISSLTEH